MKTPFKLCIAITFLSFSASVSAQNFAQSGTTELGGDISFSSQSSPSNYSSSSTLTTFSFNPYVGFMTSGGFELGLMPGITSLSQGNISATELNFFVAPSYNISTGSTVYPCLEFLIGYNSINLKSSSVFSGSSTQTADGLGIGFDAGMKVNIKGNSLLLLKIQYLHQSYRESNSSPYSSSSSYSSNETIINTVSFGMGFRIFIERKAMKK